MDKVPESFFCTMCLKVYKDPQRMQCCGHIYCYSCVLECYKANPRPICATCRSTSFTHISVKELRRKIESLLVRCCLKGCGWIGELVCFKQHPCGIQGGSEEKKSVKKRLTKWGESLDRAVERRDINQETRSKGCSSSPGTQTSHKLFGRRDLSLQQLVSNDYCKAKTKAGIKDSFPKTSEFESRATTERKLFSKDTLTSRKVVESKRHGTPYKPEASSWNYAHVGSEKKITSEMQNCMVTERIMARGSRDLAELKLKKCEDAAAGKNSFLREFVKLQVAVDVSRVMMSRKSLVFDTMPCFQKVKDGKLVYNSKKSTLNGAIAYYKIKGTPQSKTLMIELYCTARYTPATSFRLLLCVFPKKVRYLGTFSTSRDATHIECIHLLGSETVDDSLADDLGYLLLKRWTINISSEWEYNYVAWDTVTWGLSCMVITE